MAPSPTGATEARPAVPAEIGEVFLPARRAGGRLVYRPAVLGTADLHFANARAKVDHWETVAYVAPLKGRVSAKLWNDAVVLGAGEPDLRREPEVGAEYGPLPSAGSKASSYRTWQGAFKTHLYQHRTLSLLRCPALKLIAEPEETEAGFRVRVREAAREKRDMAVEKLRRKYAPKLERLQDRIRRAEEKVGQEKSQYEQQKMQTAISMGATVLGALLGRKAASIGTVGRAATTARGVGRAAREKGDIARAKRDLESLRQKFDDLEAEFNAEVTALSGLSDPAEMEIETTVVRPRKSDIAVGHFGLAWLPYSVGDDGIAEAAY
jgi:hypothetical protein